MNTLLREISAVFLDADGCVINSAEANKIAHRKLTGRAPSEDIRKRIRGLSNYESWKIICKEYNLSETPEEMVKRRDEIMKTIYPTLRLKDGVEDFLGALRERNIPYCITASCSREHLELKLSGHKEILENAKCVVTNESDVQPKPSPDIFLKAIGMMENVGPANVLVVEDSVKGIQAAANCNMRTLFISQDEKEGIAPTHRVGSLAQLKL